MCLYTPNETLIALSKTVKTRLTKTKKHRYKEKEKQISFQTEGERMQENEGNWSLEINSVRSKGKQQISDRELETL